MIIYSVTVVKKRWRRWGKSIWLQKNLARSLSPEVYITQQAVCSNFFLTMNIKCALLLDCQRSSAFLRLQLNCIIWKQNSTRRVFYCASQMGYIFSWRFSVTPIKDLCGFSIPYRNKAGRIFCNFTICLIIMADDGRQKRISISNILTILVFCCLWFIICLPGWFMITTRFFFNYFGDLFRIIRFIWLLKKNNSFTQSQQKCCKLKW